MTIMKKRGDFAGHLMVRGSKTGQNGGGWVRVGVMKSFLNPEFEHGGHSFPHEMDGHLGQGGRPAQPDCQIDGIKNKFLLDI